MYFWKAFARNTCVFSDLLETINKFKIYEEANAPIYYPAWPFPILLSIFQVQTLFPSDSFLSSLNLHQTSACKTITDTKFRTIWNWWNTFYYETEVYTSATICTVVLHLISWDLVQKSTALCILAYPVISKIKLSNSLYLCFLYVCFSGSFELLGVGLEVVLVDH